MFVANDKGGICKIYDGKSFQAVGELDFKDDADNVRYDDARKKSMSDLAAEASPLLMRPTENRSAPSNSTRIPKLFELEKNGNRIFVNVPNSRHVAVIDRDKGEVVATMENRPGLWKFSYGT